jgi:hypothetical protein
LGQTVPEKEKEVKGRKKKRERSKFLRGRRKKETHNSSFHPPPKTLKPPDSSYLVIYIVSSYIHKLELETPLRIILTGFVV